MRDGILIPPFGGQYDPYPSWAKIVPSDSVVDGFGDGVDVGGQRVGCGDGVFAGPAQPPADDQETFAIRRPERGRFS